jgi:hypothetical protein
MPHLKLVCPPVWGGRARTPARARKTAGRLPDHIGQYWGCADATGRSEGDRNHIGTGGMDAKAGSMEGRCNAECNDINACKEIYLRRVRDNAGRIYCMNDQHGEVEALVLDMLGRIDTATAEDLARDLRVLAAIVWTHLWMEDRYLYAQFFRHKDEDIRTRAASLRNETARHTDRFAAFADRWSEPDVISGDTEGFALEARDQFGELLGRIRAEKAQLYPHCRA